VCEPSRQAGSEMYIYALRHTANHTTTALHRCSC